MPRKKTARRFSPCNSIVSQNMVDEEAKYVAREFTDQSYELATKSWEALMQELASLPDRDAEALRAILFRDFFHLLECYRSFIRIHRPAGVKGITLDSKTVERHEKFSEWLFQLDRKEE